MTTSSADLGAHSYLQSLVFCGSVLQPKLHRYEQADNLEVIPGHIGYGIMISNASRNKLHLALEGDKDEIGQNIQADSVAGKLNINHKLTIRICDFCVQSSLLHEL